MYTSQCKAAPVSTTHHHRPACLRAFHGQSLETKPILVRPLLTGRDHRVYGPVYVSTHIQVYRTPWNLEPQDAVWRTAQRTYIDSCDMRGHIDHLELQLLLYNSIPSLYIPADSDRTLQQRIFTVHSIIIDMLLYNNYLYTKHKSDIRHNIIMIFTDIAL